MKRFGPPSREAEFLSPDALKIVIWKWKEGIIDEGVCIYATIGATETLIGSEQRCEFFLGLSPEVDDVAETLAEVALHGVGNGKVPAYGDTVTMSNRLWSGTVIRTLLFSSGGDEIIPPITNSAATVEFIQLVPLFPNELEYKKRFGEAALWEQFEAQEIDYWNAQRIDGFNQ